MTPTTSDRTTSGRLSDHLESLQEGFRKLSKASGVDDLAGKFRSVLEVLLPGAEIELAYRPAAATSWQSIAPGAPPSSVHQFPLPDDHTPSLSFLGAGGTSITVVQRLVDKSCIGLVVSQGTAAGAYASDDVISLRLFVNLFDNAYQTLLHRRNEKSLIFSLNHRVLQLNSLIDTGIEVAKLDGETTPHQLALERAASLTNASKGLVSISREGRETETVFFPAGRMNRASGDGTNRITSTFTFAEARYTFELEEKESRAGVLPFEETDQVLLDALVRQVHASLENRYLHQQALEKQKIEQEIAVAASIQQRILPAALPIIEGYDIAGINIPSKSVGGDYFDCIPLADGRYALVIADVAGKGVAAALLVSSLHAYFSAYLETGMSLVELMVRLNRVICRASTDDKFITAFIALLTPATGEVEAINGGHNPVYWLKSDNTVNELSRGGVPLGMLDMDFPYESERITLASGERMLLYTDGITEANNDRNDLYDSDAPLKEFVKRNTPARAGAFIDDLIADVKRFTGTAPQNDDITALYLLRR